MTIFHSVRACGPPCSVASATGSVMTASCTGDEQRPQIGIPRPHEAEDRQRRQRGLGKRQDDAPEDREVVRAVEEGGFLEVTRKS